MQLICNDLTVSNWFKNRRQRDKTSNKSNVHNVR